MASPQSSSSSIIPQSSLSHHSLGIRHPERFLAFESRSIHGSLDDLFRHPFYQIQKEFDQRMLEYINHINLVKELGGKEVLQEINNRLYDKIIEEPRLASFFEGKDIDRIRRHSFKMMGIAFSEHIPAGRDDDMYKRIMKIHKDDIEQRGMNEQHFDIMMELFTDVLNEFEVPEDLIDIATEIPMSFRFCFASNFFEEAITLFFIFCLTYLCTPPTL